MVTYKTSNEADVVIKQMPEPEQGAYYPSPIVNRQGVYVGWVIRWRQPYVDGRSLMDHIVDGTYKKTL